MRSSWEDLRWAGLEVKQLAKRWIFGVAIALAAGLIMGAMGVPDAQAKEFCRTSGDREVCILRIERSAKNFREYRAQVKIDGEKRPLEAYDCQKRLRRRKDGTRIPFEPNGAGEIVCGALDK
ncbi:MAG: hypothetical protein AAFY11_15100 [Cyanobacteria bacterium J06641_5]